MVRGGPAGSAGVREPPGDGKRATRAVGQIAAVGQQLAVHAPTNHLGHRYAEPLRAASDLPVLTRLELYLETHHDGMMIPSWPAGWRRPAAAVRTAQLSRGLSSILPIPVNRPYSR